jgi:hypothetical protein
MAATPEFPYCRHSLCDPDPITAGAGANRTFAEGCSVASIISRRAASRELQVDNGNSPKEMISDSSDFGTLGCPTCMVGRNRLDSWNQHPLYESRRWRRAPGIGGLWIAQISSTKLSVICFDRSPGMLIPSGDISRISDQSIAAASGRLISLLLKTLEEITRLFFGKPMLIPVKWMASLLLNRLVRLFFDKVDQLRSGGRGVLLR